jgi:amidohydrolase
MRTDHVPDPAPSLHAIEPRLIEWRRHLHRYPELSFREYETATYVAGELAELDRIEIERPTDTSVVAHIRTGRPGPVVALRADMDALPIQERSGCPFESTRPGVMHACGHDGHTAMLLGAAHALVEMANLLPGGEVRFIFQHAEEKLPGGASELVAAGVLEGVSQIYGCHLWTPLPVGQVAVTPGPFMAASDSFRVTIRGRGGHPASPHLGVDAIAVAAEVVTNLQHIVARRTDPLESVVVSIGSFHAGNAPNIIAEQAELTGTTRALTVQRRESLPALLEALSTGIATAHGATCEFKFEFGYAPLVNDAQCAALVRCAVEDRLGASALADLEPVMGGDDFSAYLAVVPGCYALVGAGSEEAGATYAHHDARFRIDERALAIGTRLLVAVTLRALQERASARASAPDDC